jgi:superfamily II DNA or RNA helicase
MLYAHQQKVIDQNPDKYLLAHDTGAGKSLTSIELAKRKGTATLIICPKALAQNWKRELDKHGFTLPNLIITKETFRRDWDKLELFPTVIVDEAHFFAGRTSAMSKALMKYFKKHRTPYRYLLTATPYMSTPWNIYTIAELLDHSLSYKWFDSTFFYKIPMGARLVPIVRSGIEPQLRAIIQSIGSTVTLQECFDVPEQLDVLETFDLTKEQIKAIDGITDAEHIVYWTKRHQIENGSLKGDGYTTTQIYPSHKVDSIVNTVNENPKTAIICRYNAQIDALAQILKDKTKREVLIINGAVKDRDAVVQHAEMCNNCTVLIQASCAEGYELPSIGVIIFASLDFSYVKYKQMKGRFLRGNKLKKNVFIHMVVDKGVDRDVYSNIIDKKDFSFEIYKNLEK